MKGTFMSITIEQATAMLELQAQMQAKISPTWITAGWPFLRAIVVEGGEAIDHHGWKWWKAQTPDMSQLQIEIIDVLHFVLSEYVVAANGEIALAAARFVADVGAPLRGAIVFDGKEYTPLQMDTVSKLELMIGLAVARRTSTWLLALLAQDTGMSWDMVFRQYVGKNVLNFFRQDHGYNVPNKYQKFWFGREDNVHLAELLTEIGERSDLRLALYDKLAERYARAVAEGFATNTAAA